MIQVDVSNQLQGSYSILSCLLLDWTLMESSEKVILKSVARDIVHSSLFTLRYEIRRNFYLPWLHSL